MHGQAIMVHRRVPPSRTVIGRQQRRMVKEPKSSPVDTADHCQQRRQADDHVPLDGDFVLQLWSQNLRLMDELRLWNELRLDHRHLLLMTLLRLPRPSLCKGEEIGL